MLDKMDKRRTFQEASQSFEQAEDGFLNLDPDAADYGTKLKNLRQEADEAYQQIQTALAVASEHQKEQLYRFQNELDRFLTETDQL